MYPSTPVDPTAPYAVAAAHPTYPAAPPPPPRRTRTGLVAAIVGVLIGLVGAAGIVLAMLGFFGSSVPRADVAAGISTQLASRGVTATTVDCPQDLPAKVGESVRCTYTVDGKPVGVTAKVSSLQGDNAVFDITSDAPLVTREDVAGAIDDYVKTLSYTADGATTCPGALIGETGRSVRCEFTVGGQPVDATATVSSVTDSKAKFDIALEARPVSQELVEQDIAYSLTHDYGATVDSVTCAGGLDPKVGDSVLCTATGGGERLDLQVGVASVDDGLVGYQLQLA
jgi:hypothetical protein